MYEERIWVYDIHRRAILLIERPPRGTDFSLPPTILIEIRDFFEGLVECLEQNGFIKPRLDERLRVEDLKITHRLLDLLDSKLPRGGKP